VNPIQVAIIGVGPRGLSILQRLSELFHQLPGGCAVEVHLVDPGDSGQGVHSSRQPSYLLTNTIANQVTMFSDGRGPSFTKWSNEAGYRRFSRAYFPTGDDAGETVGEHDYLPRSMLGEYLSWVFDRTVRALPSDVHLIHHRDRAVDIENIGAGRLAIRLAQGAEIYSDFAILATGHCERIPTDEDSAFETFTQENAARNHRLVYCSNPYPVDKLQRIAPGADVAVQGFGLTAYDVISALTVGRGGCFERTGKEMRYFPSGREPNIHLFSRQCLPFSARGVNQKGTTGQHRAQFFTREAVQRLKKRATSCRKGGQLDFEAEVLPLLLREMGYAYRTATEQRYLPPEEYHFCPADRRAVESIIDPLRGRSFANHSEFKKFFVEYIVNDLKQAELGNVAGPVKAATDVIRDTRASLREAVEFAGLTPSSHQTFNAKYVPMMNRISFGPPMQRNFELLALLNAGVVNLAGGPGCCIVTDQGAAKFAIHTDFGDGRETRYVDALVIARLDPFRPERDRSPLVGNLLARGLIRPYSNGSFKPGGIDIDENGHPINAAGSALPNVWAVGYLVEGPCFYTHALPRQGLISQFISDADTCVRDMLAQIEERVKIGGNEYVHSYRQCVSLS
jgi:uncharacterized NAD(P)/FAD-binding protein YdhS